MRRSDRLAVGIVLLALTFAASARAKKSSPKKESAAVAPEKQADIFANLKFRNIGPAAAGGRVAAVVGIAGTPNVYYVGAAGGGVWKTTDGGNSWKAVFEKEPTASIGAITLAPSNPNIVWVGTGEANPRNDVLDGKGVYLSTDAGQSWKFMGLKDAGQISQIIVNPDNPAIVLVAALGHVWGPNQERGVFRTTDGGKTWTKVLYVNDTTGCADLQMMPGNPMVLMAAMWQFRRYPWKLDDGGDGSAIYRSTDGGVTWTKLTKDMPKGPLGRIALGFAPTNPHKVFALIEAKSGMLWVSNNLGDDWSEVSDNHAVDVRPFYFSKVYVAPDNENHLFFCSFQLMESTDGGKTAHSLDHHVHPDHHALWIDPRNPQRMIQGNDGGVYVTDDGGKSWRYLDNLPIGQFYMVAADNDTPYNLCGGLQDNNAWCGAANSLSFSGVTGSDWYVVAGGDGEYAMAAPSDSNIIYGESQTGDIVRFDRKSKISAFIRPSIESVETEKPANLKYRFNWTTPFAVSATDPNTIFIGANVLFKSTDGGKSWAAISGDLTRNDKSKQEVSGGPINYDISGAENYDTILSISVAPTDGNVLWVGTDDGNVQVTRDGGASWQNVTPHGAPEWARVYQVGVSPFDAGTAYVSFDAHELDNRDARVYRTNDYGRHWTEISQGLPSDPVYVVREDPNQKGLLVAGTDTGLFYSPDDGASWKPIKSDFPTAPVFDVKFVTKSHDLIVATHGRGIFIWDDIRPLEELSSAAENADFHLFSSAPGTQYHFWNGHGFDAGPGYSAPNPPNGVAVDYFLKKELKASPEEKGAHQGPVRIVVTDAKGQMVTTAYGPSKEGINRWVWNMRYDGSTQLDFVKRSGEEGFFNRSRGPSVLPGTYNIAVTVGGQTQTTTAAVEHDPRFEVDPAVFRAQTETGLRARNDLSALNEMLNNVTAMQKSLTGFDHSLPRTTDEERARRAKFEPILQQGKDLGKKLETLKESVYDSKVQTTAPEDSIHYLGKFHDKLGEAMFRSASAYNLPPSKISLDYIAGLETTLKDKIADYNNLLHNDVASYNKAAYAAGAPTIFAGEPVRVEPPPAL